MQNYMESIYLVLVVLLFLLAASDLWVGVGNDAVNFMNSAIVSGPFEIINVLRCSASDLGSLAALSTQ